MPASKKSNGFSVTVHRGDAKTLLGFNLTKAKSVRLAGFTIECKAGTRKSFFLFNLLRFKKPADHVQVAGELPTSSVNAPIHRFRWLHVPGSAHQGTKPFFGSYTYTVTPRYFDDHGSLTAIDPKLSLPVTVEVGPFVKGKIAVGFTRGFIQSQAFVRHFSKKAKFQPAGGKLLFDTAQVSGKNDLGEQYTFAEEYEWLGQTARQMLFGIVEEVLRDKSLRLDVFIYDFNEPDLAAAFLELAKQGRIRVISDDAALHHNKTKPTREDQFETLFAKAAKAPAEIRRGKFARYAHDKVLIVSNAVGPIKVLTGSTNLSITGLYVNSNHVIVFDDPGVAALYSRVFESAWQDRLSAPKFRKTAEATDPFSFAGKGLPKTEITFAPHDPVIAQKNLDALVARITTEAATANGNIMFAVMGLDKKSTGPVFPALRELHQNETIFTYGISDTPEGIFLYDRGRKTGVLVTGKPVATRLPPPFNDVPGISFGHQVHHKFIVCGFNGKDPVVFCGSSNLALGGEMENGDNLIAIHDRDIATAFAIEALALVDHFEFLDRQSAKASPAKKKAPVAPDTASKEQMAEEAEWFLSTTDRWAAPYFDPNDLHSVDRELFA